MYKWHKQQVHSFVITYFKLITRQEFPWSWTQAYYLMLWYDYEAVESRTHRQAETGTVHNVQAYVLLLFVQEVTFHCSGYCSPLERVLNNWVHQCCYMKSYTRDSHQAPWEERDTQSLKGCCCLLLRLVEERSFLAAEPCAEILSEQEEDLGGHVHYAYWC